MSGIFWERQPKESDEAWKAFQTYLSLGDERSYAKVSQKLGKSKTIIERWGRNWHWLERIRTRDNWLVLEEDKAQIKKVRERTINRGKLYDNVFATQAKYILYLASKEPANLTIREAEYLMKNADKLFQDHKEMYTLTAYQQSQEKLNKARIDLEIMRLEASQSVQAMEITTNFEEMLKAAVDDVWSDNTSTDKKEIENN